MLTRRRAATRVCKSEGFYEFTSKDGFVRDVLPTKRDVLQRLLHEDCWQTRAAREVVAQELVDVWVFCNVYPVSVKAVALRLETLAKSFKKLHSQPKNRRKNDNYSNLVANFMADINDLFDIFCKDNQQRRKVEEKYKLRMTESDFDFYNDQKGPRIAKCLNVVEKLQPSDKTFARMVGYKMQQVPSTSAQSDEQMQLVLDDSFSQSSSSASEVTTSENFLPAKRLKVTSSKQNRASLKEIAKISERYGLSDRAAAAIANATLKDFGMISSDDASLVIDRSKLRRERQKYRIEIQEEEKSLLDLVDSVYVDGRTDDTLITVEVNEKHYRQLVKEHHHVIIGEPGEFYLTYIATKNSQGVTIAKSILNVIENTQLADKLIIIGTDGTPSMTGYKSGLIASLEKLLGRPLQWVVCMLHLIELPLRHVFQMLDGTTTGPESFSGPIGKAIAGKVSDWQVNSFKKIEVNDFPTLPNHVLESLSSDQYYAYEICQAVISGNMTEDLKLLEIGKLSHARWLTLGCRVLRYYVAQNIPSASLKSLAEFAVKVYFPCWFNIKLNCKITDGSKNFFNIIERTSKIQNKEILGVVKNVLQRNGFFAHFENVALAMLADEDETIRRTAVNKILQIREALKQNMPETFSSASSNEIRKFEIPQIDFDARSYHSMINLNQSNLSEPPALKSLQLQEIEAMRKHKLIMNHPCHNQAVERHIKVVTEASSLFCTFEQRDGSIRQKLRSRQLMKKFDTKKQFTV